MRSKLGLLLCILCAAPVLAAGPGAGDDPRLVEARLPRLAAAVAHGGGRLCLVYGGGLSSAGETVAADLARRLSGLLNGPVAAVAVPALRVHAAYDDGLVTEAAAAVRADVTVLDTAGLAGTMPPDIAAAWLCALVQALVQAGGDVVVLTPLPLESSPEAFRAALEAAAAADRQLGALAQVVDGAQAMWPEEVRDPAAAGVAFTRLVAAGQVTPEGAARLVAYIGRQLSNGSDGRPLSVSAAVRLRPGAESVVGLRLRNRRERAVRAKLVLLSPLELAAGGAVEAELGPLEVAQPIRAVRLPAASALADDPRQARDWGGDGVACGMVFCEPGESRLFRCPLRSAGLAAGAGAGRQVSLGAAVVPVVISDTTGRPRSGYLSGLPGRPVQAFQLNAEASCTIPVNLLLPNETRGRCDLVAEAVADGERAPVVAPVRYAAAATARTDTARIDGGLGEWADDSWYSVALPDQVSEGRSDWHFAADGSLRWAARTGTDGLQVALVVRDNQLTDGDQVELLWDARPGGELGRGGPPRRLTLALQARALRGRGADAVRSGWSVAGAEQAVEVELPWALVGRRPEPGELVGFDVRVIDQDGGAHRHLLEWTGEAWSWADASRLGLLQLGGPPQRAYRLLVGLAD